MKSYSLTLLCLIGLVAASPAAQDYEIRMHRPAKVGQRFSVSVTGKDLMDMAITAAGSKVNGQHKELNAEYEAEVTVVEVGANGRPVKETHKVGRLVSITAGEKKSLVEKGTVVTAFRRNHKSAFEIAGAPVEKELSEALDLVIDTNDGDAQNDDEVLGTRERKKPGESWTANREALEKLISKDASLQVENPSGKLTLKEAIKEAGGEALVIEGTIKASAKLPAPQGLTTKEATISVALTGTFPVDVVVPRTRENMAMNMSFIASGKPQPDGPEVELKMTASRTVTRKQTVLK